jgi:hypothetical protein
MFLAAALPCLAQAVGQDVEMWNEVDIISPFFHHSTLTVPLVLRDSFELSNPQLGGVGPILDIPLGRHLTATVGYLYVGVPHIGPGFNANVPLGAVTVHQSFKGFEFADRNRAECLFGIPEKPIRYRNKLVIEAPKIEATWRPYLSDEAFYDFSQALWSQNRLQAGVVHSLSRTLRINLFYLERDEHRLDPTATHALGVALEIHLERGVRRRGVPNEEN